jgi:hypothetical protein
MRSGTLCAGRSCSPGARMWLLRNVAQLGPALRAGAVHHLE